MKDLYKTTGIYAIRNKLSGKMYIGQTTMNFGDRRDTHYSLLRNNKHHNHELQSDWNLYGADAFEFIVLEMCNDSDLSELETRYIIYYNNSNMAYNVSFGKGQLGCTPSDEAKRKIGEKNRINMIGRHLSDETKEKMSKSHRGRKMSESAKEALRQSNIGRKASEETRAKLRFVNQTKSAKITPKEVREIRELRDSGVKVAVIAEMYGLATATIYGITNRKRWVNVD